MARLGWGTALFLLGFAGLARGEETETTKWVGKGIVEYVLEHRLHTVVGRSEEPEFVMVIDGEGLRVMARVPVRSFDSGNANRDAEALAVVKAEQHPYVIVRGVAPGVRRPAGEARMQVSLDAEIELRGTKVRRPIPVDLEFRKDGSVSASFAFTQSLEAHRVKRPSLLLVKVADELEVRGEALLEVEK